MKKRDRRSFKSFYLKWTSWKRTWEAREARTPMQTVRKQDQQYLCTLSYPFSTHSCQTQPKGTRSLPHLTRHDHEVSSDTQGSSWSHAPLRLVTWQVTYYHCWTGVYAYTLVMCICVCLYMWFAASVVKVVSLDSFHGIFHHGLIPDVHYIIMWPTDWSMPCHMMIWSSCCHSKRRYGNSQLNVVGTRIHVMLWL